MCMEDVKLGRNTQPSFSTVTVATTAKQLVPNSGARWSLHIMPPSSGVVWIAPGQTVVAGQGYCLAAGDLPLVFRITDDGEQVLQPWQVIADAGAPVVAVIEHRLIPGSDRPIVSPGGGY